MMDVYVPKVFGNIIRVSDTKLRKKSQAGPISKVHN